MQLSIQAPMCPQVLDLINSTTKSQQKVRIKQAACEHNYPCTHAIQCPDEDRTQDWNGTLVTLVVCSPLNLALILLWVGKILSLEEMRRTVRFMFCIIVLWQLRQWSNPAKFATRNSSLMFAPVLGNKPHPHTPVHCPGLQTVSQRANLQHFRRLDRAGLPTGRGFRVPVGVPGCLVTGKEQSRRDEATQASRSGGEVYTTSSPEVGSYSSQGRKRRELEGDLKGCHLPFLSGVNPLPHPTCSEEWFGLGVTWEQHPYKTP